MTALSRRLILRGTAVAAVTLPTLAARPLGAQTAASAPADSAVPGGALMGASFYRLSLGTKTLTILADGASTFPGQPVFAVNASADAFAAEQAHQFEPAETLNFHMNTMLVEEGGRRILIDAGVGHVFGSDFGRQATALANAGIDPSSIDTVIITHGHPDHFGGLLAADGSPRFPNARIVWPDREWAYWTSEQALTDLGNSRIPDAFKTTFLDATRTVLPATRALTEPTAGDEVELAPGVVLLAAPGHTPHSAVVLIESQGRQLLYASDTTVLPAHNARHPEWITVFEMDPIQVVATRRRLLDRAASDGILWMGYHAPFPALGHIRASGAAWEYVPVGWRWA